ncbi:tripartite motif-containing protein 45 isoform X3 [Cotesia glomerata]|uniref:tripartite motif-containing protein 45 isoform X3 n=1 Tax=Cotesia glomerata TaxID=32391 RepID=UPI001D00CAEA|nr:tripartite motif-containing protein 45 isoform X3 [Cotesia glomerata]
MCQQRMQEPRLLDCLHPLCLNCVKACRSLAEEDSRDDSPWRRPDETKGCPTCDHPFSSPEKPLPPPHYPLQHRILIDAIITQQLLCYCDGCHGQVQASLHCSTCLRNFCENCGAEHQKIRTRTGTHEIVALWQAKRFRRTTVCLDHPQHSLRFYCIACQQVTCCECMWRESHRGHACENHKTAGRTAARILANAVQDARILLNSLLVNYTLKSFSAVNLYRKRFSFRNQRINLQENEKQFLHAQEAKQRIEEFRRLETSRHLLDAISLAEQLLAEGLGAEILCLSKVILKRLQKLGLPVQPSFGISKLFFYFFNKCLGDVYRGKNHPGVFHCCTFCSSGGKKETMCFCQGTMPGGYRGCGHAHFGHPGVKHWSCCGSTDRNSICTQWKIRNPPFFSF